MGCYFFFLLVLYLFRIFPYNKGALSFCGKAGQIPTVCFNNNLYWHQIPQFYFTASLFFFTVYISKSLLGLCLLHMAQQHNSLVDDVVAAHFSVGIRLGPRGRSLPGCFSSAKKGALVSWERELLPSPDAEALPGDSVMSSDQRKCSVRARPGSLSAACTPGGWETKSLRSFSEAGATCGIHLQQDCEEPMQEKHGKQLRDTCGRQTAIFSCRCESLALP